MDQDRIYIITLATDLSKARALFESAFLHDTMDSMIVMNNSQEWHGYIQKLQAMREQLAKIPDPQAIICFIDAYDVVISASPKEMIDKFKAMNADLVIGAEMNCFPPWFTERYAEVPECDFDAEHPSGHRYVNSGAYIGRKAAIERFLNYFSAAEIHSYCKNGTDQMVLTEYYLREHSDRIILDRNCQLFWNMHLVRWDDIGIMKGRLYNKELRCWPCFVHFNGSVHQTNEGSNILPILTERMQASLDEGSIKDLSDFKQIVTDTCIPRSQLFVSTPDLVSAPSTVVECPTRG